MLDAYRNATSDLARMKYALIAWPEFETQVGAPLIARQESRIQAAELAILAAYKRKGNAE